MTYKRNAHITSVQLTRATYTSFGEPNTNYFCLTNGTGMNVTLKPVSSFSAGDRLRFTVFNGNVAFGTFNGGGSNDFVDTSGGSTGTPPYKPLVKQPLYLILFSNKWCYEGFFE